jgi:ribonuclease VapC
MIVDSSAVVAVFLKEPGFEALLKKLGANSTAGIGTPNLVECGIVLSARLGRDARPLLLRFVQEFEIAPVPFGEVHWREALDAYWRFGKGRHVAALNLGDCCAYATARLAGRPLLCTGGDFARTDLDLA